MTTKTQRLTDKLAVSYHMTNKELGVVFGVSERTILRWRSGVTQMPTDTAKAILQVMSGDTNLRCPPDELGERMVEVLYGAELGRQVAQMDRRTYKLLKRIVAERDAVELDNAAFVAEFDREYSALDNI